MWHCIFRIFFTGSKFSETWKTIIHLITSDSSLIQASIECRFSLKRICDMIIIYIHSITSLIILKTYVQYFHHRFINQKWNVKTGVHIFTKIKQTVGSRKKFSFFISEIPKFSHMRFFRKSSMFCRSISLISKAKFGYNYLHIYHYVLTLFTPPPISGIYPPLGLTPLPLKLNS